MASGTVLRWVITGNEGNTFIMSRLMSREFPVLSILAELAAWLKALGIQLELGCAPRGQNREANELTSENLSDLDKNRRIHIGVESLGRKVLPAMPRACARSR